MCFIVFFLFISFLRVSIPIGLSPTNSPICCSFPPSKICFFNYLFCFYASRFSCFLLLIWIWGIFLFEILELDFPKSHSTVWGNVLIWCCRWKCFREVCTCVFLWKKFQFLQKCIENITWSEDPGTGRSWFPLIARSVSFSAVKPIMFKTIYL